MRTAAVLLAAGSGSRMGAGTKKQYMLLDGKPLMSYALDTFSKGPADELVIVVSRGDEELVRRDIIAKYGIERVCAVVAGGTERYLSVMNGLGAVSDADYIMIHDLARPFVTVDIIKRALEAAVDCGAAVVGMPSKDTVRITDENGMGLDAPDRRRVWLAQTPQVFEAGLIKRAYGELIAHEAELADKGVAVTDDAQVVELFTDRRVKMIEGSWANIKVTVPEDIAMAEALLRERGA